MELVFTLGEIDEAARQFWQQAGKARVFAFHAPMGTGKTSFIIALCRALGVITPGSSPSFALVNEYQLANGEPVYHADLYRIANEAEAREAGIEELLYSGAVCLVEWPEKAPGIFPPDTVHIALGILPDSSGNQEPGTRYLRTFTAAS
ncbi:MAG: tRNA (adenosine(37)-N6)-threonylcarbamoyltransferase complex ATPase subunit type 1 TsaE [Chitinophagia bacterium]|nr:tRNA (adenosine(37)-N6)-threonylcarbamoyltransferase complex ATPase subunit type 1 TsaE [Chitinophagia bacterium]